MRAILAQMNHTVIKMGPMMKTSQRNSRWYLSLVALVGVDSGFVSEGKRDEWWYCPRVPPRLWKGRFE